MQGLLIFVILWPVFGIVSCVGMLLDDSKRQKGESTFILGRYTALGRMLLILFAVIGGYVTAGVCGWMAWYSFGRKLLKIAS